MEHQHQSDQYNQDHHHEHEVEATLDVSYEASHEAHEGPQDAQPQQTYPENQQRFQSKSPAPPPSRAPPSLPAQQTPSHYPNQGYPNEPPRAYQPQANPQYYPQAGYASAHPVQAPPTHYQPQTNPEGDNKPHQNSPYNTNADAPGGYENGVQMQGKPAPGYMVNQPQYQMSSYGNNPGSVAWTTGLFDCMEDPNNAFITFCCPCFTFGQIAEIVDRGQTSCGTSGIIYGAIAALVGIPCILSCTYRSKMRNQYDLLEVPAADWLTHCFCECCALCQEYRELRNRGLDPALGWHGNMMRNQNMQDPQVAMAPPINQTMEGPMAR